MTEAQKQTLTGMLTTADKRYGESSMDQQEVDGSQTFALCLIALQLDRIATALEHPTPNYDPHVSTAINRIASDIEAYAKE